jgi:sphingosine-1-phosphate phosphatase 1
MILASVLLPILLPLVDFLDPFLLTHPAAPCLLITTTVTLMLLYPGSKFSSAREDTAVILGSAMGLYLGAWMSYQMGSIRGPPIKPPYSILWPSFEMLGTSLLRTVIGLVTVVATRALAKPLGRTVIRTVLLLVKDNVKEEEIEANVKLGTKLFTYGLVGVDVTWLAPAVFRLLTIERPTFHTEI